MSSKSIRLLLQVRPLAKFLTLFSKVWLRHARTYAHLRNFDFDAVVDGGANIGEFAHLARSALPLAHLVCVEPHPESAEYLQRHGFEVFRFALWDSQTKLTLSQPSSRSTSCTVLAVPESKHSWTVETIRLDDLPIKGQRVLVKLDLQGSEVKALQGMERLWSRCAALLLEVNIGTNGTYETIRQLLTQQGYWEYSTLNELEFGERVAEADKLWVRPQLLGPWKPGTSETKSVSQGPHVPD